MNHIALDAADAAELIEILEYFIETLDRVATHHHPTQLCADPTSYDIDDLRADLARLVDHLKLSAFAP
jgi:hypothetical protein